MHRNHFGLCKRDGILRRWQPRHREESARTNTWQGRLRSEGATIFILPRNQHVYCRLRKHENMLSRASHESEIGNIAANRWSKQAVRRRCVRRCSKAMTLPVSSFIRAASLFASMPKPIWSFVTIRWNVGFQTSTSTWQIASRFRNLRWSSTRPSAAFAATSTTRCLRRVRIWIPPCHWNFARPLRQAFLRQDF